MAQFLPAFNFLMDNEDRGRTWAIATDNNGGQVIAGINSKSYPLDFAHIASLPQAQRGLPITEFYWEKFWDALTLGNINAQDLAARILDMAVNGGPGTAIKLAQEAVNLLQPDRVTVDGLVGPATLGAINAQDAERMLDAYRHIRLQHYQQIVAKNPEDARFLGTESNPGPWWRRAVA